ncbi:hypothetical protein BH20ACT6_BH20ACT6_07520 [soil metagenome]
MQHDIVVGVDSSETSKRAVEYACEQTQRGDRATLLLCHVIHWSPYSFTTPYENDTRPARKKEEIEAAETQVLQPLVELAREHGVPAESMVRHGDPADMLIHIVDEVGGKAVVVGRTGDSRMRSRVFGTLPSHLVQECPVSVTVVP